MKVYTIKSSQEISYIFSNGTYYRSPYFTLITLRKGHDHKGRVAFIAGKKYGGAVWRNKSKRRLREIYRNVSLSQTSYDVIMLARPNLMNVSFQKVMTSAETLVKTFYKNELHA